MVMFTSRVDEPNNTELEQATQQVTRQCRLFYLQNDKNRRGFLSHLDSFM